MSTTQSPERPGGRSGLSKGILRALKEAQAELAEVVERLLAAGTPTSPGELYDFERKLHSEVARLCVDRVVSEVIQTAHDSTEVAAVAAEIVGEYPDVRLQKSGQAVTIRLFGGSTVTISSPYFLMRNEPVPGRKRQQEGNGVYPRLAALGIHYRVTPALAAEVGRLVALGPIEQAMDTLTLRGVVLDIKTVHRLAQRLGERALHYREWLQDRENQKAATTNWAKGKRIVFAVDGGRLRTRTARETAALKGKRKGFIPHWKEPKVLVIYAIDDDGRKHKKAGVYYDATMGNADQAFAVLEALLRTIGAELAKEWIVVADGAAWIWNRIAPLAKRVGIPAGGVTEIVDFYHACEYLSAVSDAVTGWTAGERKAWYHRMKTLLREQGSTAVIEILQRLSPLRIDNGDGSSTDPLHYFTEHLQRMNYPAYRDRRIPIGSGAVESAVRRIVNLRLKSNGSFWDLNNAETVLHLRSQLLSGRWHAFVITVLNHEVFWRSKSRVGRTECAA